MGLFQDKTVSVYLFVFGDGNWSDILKELMDSITTPRARPSPDARQNSLGFGEVFWDFHLFVPELIDVSFFM